MVNVQIHWGDSPETSPTMQSSSIDHLPSLSSTCPTTDTTENTSSGSHETPSLSNHVSDLQPRPTKKPVTSKLTDEVIRAAKQQIRSKLKEDWTWPPTSSFHPDTLDSEDAIVEWRERDSDSSLASTPQDPTPDPYKYDSPDSLHQPILSRKRKRKRRLKEEMEWNDGLRIYVERRDAWAGARTRPKTPPPVLKSPFDSPYAQPRPAANGNASTPPSSRTVVPVAPTILPPDHPIRATVQPATYPQIYSKIIIQGLAPTVPINLKDVVNSLVLGWKKDGEWPPRSEAEKAGLAQAVAAAGEGMVMGSHPRKAVRRSVGKVKRALGFGHGEDEAGEVEEGKPF